MPANCAESTGTIGSYNCTHELQLATGVVSMYQGNGISLGSGGNKRKLSTAIALVGNPPIVFLVSSLNYMLVYVFSQLYACLYCHKKGAFEKAHVSEIHMYMA